MSSEFVASILDRLAEQPDSASVPASTSRRLSNADAPVNVAQIKRLLLRDLQNLLNTRSWCAPISEAYKEVRTASNLSYGIPDFCSLDLSESHERQKFLSRIRQSIAAFEPRLKSISVKVLREDDPYSRSLQLKITAVLEVSTGESHVEYISSVDQEATRITVMEPRNVR